jgi:hypothetical protein
MRFSGGAGTRYPSPFSLKVKKTVWSIATDGFILLAVKLSGLTLITDTDKEVSKIKNMLLENPNNSIEINVEEFKTWAGETPNKLISPGNVEPKYQGVILGNLIDKRKLAYLFAKITVSTVSVWVSEEDTAILCFEPPKGYWRAFIIGLDSKPDGKESIFQPGSTLSALELSEMVENKS